MITATAQSIRVAFVKQQSANIVLMGLEITLQTLKPEFNNFYKYVYKF
jgi:hypothetical protein